MSLWANTEVSEWRSRAGDEVEATLSSGERLAIDHVLFATGYQVDVGRVGYLAASGLADELEVVDRVPVLDEGFGASVPGVFFAGFVATRDFGPFFGFTRGCPVAARLIVGRLLDEQPGARHDGPGQAHAGRGADTAERVAYLSPPGPVSPGSRGSHKAPGPAI